MQVPSTHSISKVFFSPSDAPPSRFVNFVAIDGSEISIARNAISVAGPSLLKNLVDRKQADNSSDKSSPINVPEISSKDLRLVKAFFEKTVDLETCSTDWLKDARRAAIAVESSTMTKAIDAAYGPATFRRAQSVIDQMGRDLDQKYRR